METIESLKRIVKGTPIKIMKVNDYTDNVRIINADGDEFVRQLGSNTGVSVTEQVKAMVRVYKRKR